MSNVVINPFQFWNPTKFPSLTGWWTAKDLASASDGTDVSTWADKSGNSRDWGQESTFALPSKETRNSFPVVQFAESNSERMTNSGVTTGTLIGSGGLSAIVCELASAPPSGGDYWLGYAFLTDANGNWHMGARDISGTDNWEGAIWDGNADTQNINPLSINTRVVLMLRLSGTTMSFSLNGGTEVTATSNGPQTTTDDMYLGSQTNGNGTPYLDGWIYETVTSTANGTAADRGQLIDYLKREWSIT